LYRRILRVLSRNFSNIGCHLDSTYDNSGALLQITYPDGNTTKFTSYDRSGNLLQRVDGNGAITNYVYNDVDERLTDIQYPASPGRNVHLTYDGYGRLSSRTDGTGSQAFAYGDLDELISVTTTYTGLAAKTISYSYYANGQRATMGTPAGTFSYSYDAAGRPAALTNPFSETTEWDYLDNNWVWKQRQVTGLAGLGRVYTYNAWGQVTHLTNGIAGTAGAPDTTLSDFAGLLYDGAGNIASVTATLPGVTALSGTTTYAYDIKNQLLSEQTTRSGGVTNTFGYDTAGNLTTFKGSGKSYNVNNQRTGTGMVYDNNGNPTTYQGTTLTFDEENHATQFGALMTAGYTADGLRAWKQNTATGTRTYYLYDGTVPVVELDATGAVSATNTFGATGLVSRHPASGSSIFYTFDERGNTVQRLDSSGNILSSHLSDAFGVTNTTAGTVTVSVGASDPFQFGGQSGYYTDAETGLVLCGHRYYDPGIGRWLNRDPIGYTGGIEAASNNPYIRQKITLNQLLLGSKREILSRITHPLLSIHHIVRHGKKRKGYYCYSLQI
jgi:RHS repeat-associated protein